MTSSVGVTIDDADLQIDYVPAARRTVLHVYGAGSNEPAVQLDFFARVRQAGWRALLVVPLAASWDVTATEAEAMGVQVFRSSVRPPGGERLGRMLRLTARRARWLSLQSVAVVDAHDDTAASAWALAARRCGVPLVWRVDLCASGSSADTLRLAGTSYLITGPAGPRMKTRWRLPPVHSVADERGSFDLAGASDEDTQFPRGMPATICDVYTCLTGVTPEPPMSTSGTESDNKLSAPARPR